MRSVFACLFVASSVAFSASGQGVTISLIDLSTRTVTSSFPACAEPDAVTWAPAAKAVDDDDDDRDHDHEHGGDRDHDRRHREHDLGRGGHSSSARPAGGGHDDDKCHLPPAASNVAYATCDLSDSLVRLDLSTPVPTVSSAFPLTTGATPVNVALNPSGTRALVNSDINHDAVEYLDVSTTPFTELGPVAAVGEVADVAFYAETKALILTEENLNVVDLSVTPPASQQVPVAPLGTALAVNKAGTLAAISIDNGGMQIVDLTRSPPAATSGVLGPPGDCLGIAISPDSAYAINVYESQPEPQAMVVSLTGAPSVANFVSLPLVAPSAVAFNPVNGDALIAGDDGISILKRPYTTVDFTIRYPGYSGSTKHAIAVSPDGTRALVVNEDEPDFALTGVMPASGPVAGGTAITLSGGPFIAGATVTLDGVPATGVVVVNGSTITAVTPAHPVPGSVEVAVTQPGGLTAVLAGGFSYDAPAPVEPLRAGAMKPTGKVSVGRAGGNDDEAKHRDRKHHQDDDDGDGHRRDCDDRDRDHDGRERG